MTDSSAAADPPKTVAPGIPWQGLPRHHWQCFTSAIRTVFQPGVKDQSNNAPRLEQTHLFREIVDARLDSVVKRSEQINTRAGLLIAAATLSATLLTDSSGNGWTALSVMLTLAAAVVGAITLFPRKDEYLSLGDLRSQILRRPPVDAELMYADQAMATYNTRVKSLNRRAWFIRIGFLFLGASILARAAVVLNLGISIGVSIG